MHSTDLKLSKKITEISGYFLITFWKKEEGHYKQRKCLL